MTRITIDPITRIEGHLRIDCEVDGGKVTKAWSSGQMWRGIEIILKDRDPRDAWIFTQRICGVCTTVHAIASVRAVENALNIEVPLNAQYIRNIIVAAHGVHDHIVHFYHLAALDWVDIVSALKGDPAGASKLGATLSDYKANSIPNISAVRDKLQTFVNSGNLGVFASGYWGHPAMKLPPDVNLLAATHYIQALEVQRIANKIVTVLGSKTPHIQNLAVGGVANAINPDSQSTLTLERLYAIKAWIDELGDFINNAMINDVAAVGALYAEWTKYGAGVTNYLSVPDLPLDTKGTKFELPGGYIPGDLVEVPADHQLPGRVFRDGVKEAVKHSWYEYSGPNGALHPFDGQTTPKYDDFHDDGKYSWIKAPTFLDKRAQVGPLANVLAMYAAGHEPTKRHLTKLVEVASKVAGSPDPAQLRCTRRSGASPPAPCVAPCCTRHCRTSGCCSSTTSPRVTCAPSIGRYSPRANSAASAITRRRAACCRTGSSSRTARSTITSASCRRPGTPARAMTTTSPGRTRRR